MNGRPPSCRTKNGRQGPFRPARAGQSQLRYSGDFHPLPLVQKVNLSRNFFFVKGALRWVRGNFTFTCLSLPALPHCRKSRVRNAQGNGGATQGACLAEPRKARFPAGPEMRPNYMKNFYKCRIAGLIPRWRGVHSRFLKYQISPRLQPRMPIASFGPDGRTRSPPAGCYRVADVKPAGGRVCLSPLSDLTAEPEARLRDATA
jgi:hypothetical protein